MTVTHRNHGAYSPSADTITTVNNLDINNNNQAHRPPFRQISSIDTPLVKASITGSSANLVNAIVGAGIVGIPFAIRESGFILGVALLILVGIFTDKSLRLIVDQATFHPKLKNMGVLTFEDMMTIPFGNIGKYFIMTSMLILAYGAMVAYLLIVKDTVPTVLGLKNSFAEREGIMVLTSFLIMLPLSMLRDISQLAFTSMLSVAADGILVVIVILYAPVKESLAEAGGFGQVLKDNWASSRLFIGLGVLSTAMACQHSAFLISNALEQHTMKRWARVTGISLTIASAMSLALGIVGYLGFLDSVQGDILNNFDPDSYVVNAARAMLAITMFLTYPMEAFVARHVLAIIFFQGNMDNMTEGADGELIPETKFCRFIGRRERWTFYLYGMTLVPALIFDDLGPVLSLTGSLGASSIAYIAPGLVYFGLNGDTFLEWTGDYLRRNGYSTGSIHVGGGEVELPVMGDSTAKMQTISDVALEHANTRKPWWWWPSLMPIWTALASRGSLGTKRFFADMGIDTDFPPNHEPNYIEVRVDGNGETAHPTREDFCYSVVFIVFGVIAAVAGVLSNIYIQVYGIFYSP